VTRSTVSLLTNAVVALAIVAATLHVIYAVASLQVLQSSTLLTGNVNDLDDLRNIQQATQSISWVQPILLPAEGLLTLTFAFWFRAVDTSERNLTKTLLAFLVPFVNVVIPFMWLRELARKRFDSQNRARAHLVEVCWALIVGWFAATIWSYVVWWQTMAEMSSLTMDFTVPDRMARIAEALRSAVTAGVAASALGVAFLLALASVAWTLGNATLTSLKRAELNE
jgi:hypothetical protein